MLGHAVGSAPTAVRRLGPPRAHRGLSIEGGTATLELRTTEIVGNDGSGIQTGPDKLGSVWSIEGAGNQIDFGP